MDIMADAGGSNESRISVLSIAIRERSTLYNAYMGGLRHGGLFVPTNRPYRLGDDVRMVISLLSHADKISVTGKVAWMTPTDCESRKVAGIGVHFNDDNDGRLAKNRIETILGPTGSSNRPTHTL